MALRAQGRGIPLRATRQAARDPPAGDQPRRELDPLQNSLLERFGIEVPIIPWPAPPRRLVRVSIQLYNTPAHYQRLAKALLELLAG